jgi:aspartyl-tRNA(Asn)/glutamyl-tRNA(Gln) amidotransferase subunit A
MKAAKVRTLIIEDFNKAFSQVDALLTPASPEVAWKI